MRPASTSTGDAYVTRGRAPWISEMYGYAFAAAEAGLTHVVHDDIMLFPGYPPDYEPSLLHYGLWCKAGDHSFNKLSYKHFGVRNCDQYFPEPPDLELILGKSKEELGTELICAPSVAKRESNPRLRGVWLGG